MNLARLADQGSGMTLMAELLLQESAFGIAQRCFARKKAANNWTVLLMTPATLSFQNVHLMGSDACLFKSAQTTQTLISVGKPRDRMGNAILTKNAKWWNAAIKRTKITACWSWIIANLLTVNARCRGNVQSTYQARNAARELMVIAFGAGAPASL